MTKEQIIKFRDEIGKDKMLKIVCDNQHIFYDNIASYPPVIWDDENETFMAIRVCQDPNVQVETPYETIQTSYEHIQFMHCYDTVASAIDLMNAYGSRLSEDKKKQFETYLSESAHNRKNWSMSYNK